MSPLRIEPLETRCLPTTITPKTFDDGGLGSGSLRDAVLQFNDDPTKEDATIQLLAGTYTLTLGNTDNLQENAALEGDLDVTSTAHRLIIQGEGPSTVIDAGRLFDRVFQIVNPGIQVIFQGLVIRGGLAQDDGTAGALAGTTDARGGGILNSGGDITLYNVLIANNVAQGGNGADGAPGRPGDDGRSAQGGGVFATGGSLTISGNTIGSNLTRGGNGGQGNYGNHGGNGGASQGGGLYATGGTLAISNSAVAGNQATGGNGGNGGTGTVTGSSHTGGAGGTGGSSQGGGLYATGGTLAISNSTVAGNQATGGNGGNGGNGFFPQGGGFGGLGGPGQGGGVYASGSAALINSTISTNTVRGGDGRNGGSSRGRGGDGGNGGAGLGGGFHVGAGTFEVSNGTVVFNTTEASVGGLGGKGFPPGKPGTSQPGQGGGVRNDSGTVSARNTLFGNNTATNHPDVSGALAGASYNLLSDGTGSNLLDGLDGNRVGSAEAPLDPLLGELQDNGGPTLTHALLPGSPALDAGDNTDAPEWDQRGEGYWRIVNDVIDIGAFEEQGMPAPGRSPVFHPGTLEGVDPAALLFLELPSRRDPFRLSGGGTG